MTTSRASLAPDITGPPTQTGSPVASALVVVFFPLSRTTVLLTRSQVQVVPSAARTTTLLPLTDWTTPRWKARVRMVPPLPWNVNCPSIPRCSAARKRRCRGPGSALAASGRPGRSPVAGLSGRRGPSSAR